MEIAVSSKSYAEPLTLWIGSRMPAARFVPVAVLLTAAAGAAGTPSASWAVGAFACALLLLFQFRLWDDLADAALDRIEHPDRILPRSESRTVFRAATWVAFTAGIGAVFALSGVVAAAGLVALCAIYAAWYAREPGARKGLVGAHLVVLKYAAFVLLLAPRPLDAHRAALACSAIYFASTAYELLHDPANRTRRGARTVAAAELVALACALILLAATFSNGGSP
jgi:4-hydroxybenzoate polyprenyltransferase